MSRTRKRYSPEFKLKAVIEILKGEKTASQLAGELEVHPVVLTEWKKHFTKSGSQIFERHRRGAKVNSEAKEKSDLYEQIGRLKMELEWLKKKWKMLS